MRTNIFVQNMNAFRELNLFTFKQNILSQKTILMLIWKWTSSTHKDRKTKLTESSSSSSTLYKETALKTPGAGPPPSDLALSPPILPTPQHLTLSWICLITSNMLVILGEEKHVVCLYLGREDMWTGSTGTEWVEPHKVLWSRSRTCWPRHKSCS